MNHFPLNKKMNLNSKNFIIFFFVLFTNLILSQTTDTYTTSGSWTVPAGVTSITVQVWGAGGAGGGSTANNQGGSGGGGGAYSTRVIAVTPGQNIPFTVGVGGLGVAGANGGNGTASTILTLTANGGTGGGANRGAIGTGGTATGGTTNTTGGNGVIGDNRGRDGGNGANGGAGGAGNINGANGNNGSTPGGGGSGGEDATNRGGNGARGEIRITYTIPPASNFTCATADSLPCATTSLAGTTVGSPGTPAHGTGCSMSNYGAWYTFVGDGQLTTISSTAGAGFDHEMSISSGTCGSLTNITCQDSGFTAGTESYTFTTTIGTNYYVYIADYSTFGSTTGTFTISRTCTAPIANDNCSGAVNVTVNPTRTCTATTSGTLFGATDSGVTGSTCGGTDDDDVWFSFVATSTSHHIELLNVAGSTTDLYHAVYAGSCGTLGAAILCSDPNTSIVSGLTIGNTYYLQIYSWTSTIGQNSTFDICISTDPPCTTPAAQATGFTPGTITSTAFPATFSGTADSYLVIRSTSATPPTQPVNGVIYNNGNVGTLGTGLSFIQSGTSTTIIGNGLSGNTHYYYYIYAYNNTNCSGGPLYNVAGALTGNAVTCPVTPSPASTSSTINSINFSWTSSIGGGANAVTYQLQVTTDAGYTANVPGSPFTINDPTIVYNLTGLTANTTYYYRIRANNGCWSTYTTGSATTGYCAATNSSNTTYYISGITTTGGVANINNTPTGFTAGGYANYTAMVVSQDAGLSFNITATHPSSTYGYTVWVDWNNDLDFSDASETVISTGYLATPAALGTVTIPGGTPPGNYRMRIRNAYLSNPAPACGSFAYGEAEDYTITVLVPAPCSGTPNGGTVTTSPNTSWPGSAYTVSSTGYSYASNLTYQWQFSTDGGTVWTNAGAASSSYADYSATAPASGIVHWQLLVTCSNSGQTGTSSTGIFTTMEVSDVETGCPSVISGGFGLAGADPAPFNCTDASTCVDLEATYLDLGDTSSYLVEPIQYNPPFSFSGLANPVSVNTDDIWSPLINLPFDFCFYGNTYNQCLIGSNGIITFDTSVNNSPGGYCSWEFDSSDPGSLPISGHNALVENSIFGVFHDINPGAGGEVGWELITLPSGCRALVASWSNVPMFDENVILYTGMMVLYENSNIIEVYIQEKNIDNFGAGTWNDGNAIVGIQNANGTIASVAPGRNGLDANWTTTNEAWRFVPNGTSITTLQWYEGSGVSGPAIGTTDVINVCPTSTTTYTAEVTYTLCDGSTITEIEETTVTVNGAKVWNGSVDTDWDNDNNWAPVGKPTALDCVVIPNVLNDPIISGTGYNGLGLNMSIQNNANLTVYTDNAVTITDWVNINSSGILNLQNSASLVQVNNIANTGNINMERIANVRLQDYSYWSSPVAGFPVQNVSPLTPAGFIFEWGTTAMNANGGQGTWLNTTENMIPAKGYILRAPSGFSNASPSALTTNFIGVPNNGTFTPTIYRGTDYSTTGTQGIPRAITDDNWNLVGNPYPSAIGVNEFLTLPANNDIVGGVRIWTHGQLPTNTTDPFYQDFVTNYYPSDYITINLTGATSGPGDYKIGAGQGFMVLMSAGAPGSSSVTFDNSMRSAAFANNQFYRNGNFQNKENNIEQNRIWLDLVSPTGLVNRTLVGYVTGATQAEDYLYDSFTDYKPSQNFYSLIGNEPMAIQGRALPFDANDKVNLGIKVSEEGLYSIAISELDGLFENTNQNIYLEDLSINIIHNLTDTPYHFMTTAGNINNRFVLRFKDKNTDTEELIENDVMLISNDILSVISTKDKIRSITIHDVIGRLISQKKNLNTNEYSFNSLQKNNTTLLVKIQLINGQTITKKVIY